MEKEHRYSDNTARIYARLFALNEGLSDTMPVLSTIWKEAKNMPLWDKAAAEMENLKNSPKTFILIRNAGLPHEIKHIQDIV